MDSQITTTDTRTNLPTVSAEGERFALRQRQARMFASSPLVPEHLRKGTPDQAVANCWIALTLAEAMGEVPLIVMQNIHVVNGKAGFASQYMIARANSSGIFKGRIDWRIDRSDPNNLAVTAYAIVKDSGQQVEVTCDMKMAKAEGWTKNPKYSTMPEVMLRYRSAAFLVRFYAPDVMLGYQTVEEVQDVVASTTASAEPLTSQMLIEQSQPATLSATPAHDEVTGEIIDEAEQDGQAAAGVSATDGPHPAQARADEIIAEFQSINSIMDLNSAESRARDDIAAMPDEIATALANEFTANKARIKAAHEKAKKDESAKEPVG